MTILNQSHNLIRLYHHMCGKSEIPESYQFWSFLSLLSACVGDRVWFEKDPTWKVKPNLYIFLIGPSALGKGAAITRALHLFKDACVSEENINAALYNGQTTAAHFVDVLGGRTNDEGVTLIPHPVKWLVTDELSNDIGKGKLAEDFVKLMTKIYAGSVIPFDTGTRTHGHVKVTDPCITWLAGSTEEWMIESVTGKTLQSGFGSRVVFVKAEYNNKRLRRAKYPSDYQQVWDHIVARLMMLRMITGKFYMTPDAEKEEDQWYMNRKRPTDERLMPSWKREQDMMLKTAMLLSLADGGPLVIQAHHIKRAVQTCKSVKSHLNKVINLASQTTFTSITAQIETIIKGEKEIGHSVLYNKMRGRGIDKRSLREGVDALRQEKLIVDDFTDTGGRIYRWVGGE